MKAKKIVIPVCIIAGIAAIGAGVAALGNSAANVAYADTARVTQKNLENKISVSGTVESSQMKKVYSMLSTYPIETVNVKVGDAVKKGDVLCTINTEELQQQILQQQASVESSGINTDYSVSEAEENYAEALEKYESGENPTIVSAARAVEQAEKNLEEAKRREKFGTDTALPSNMQTADANVQNAKAAYDSAVSAYDNAVKAYDNTKSAYDKAVKELDPENYPVNVKTVYDTLEEHKKNYNIVRQHLTNVELSKAESEYNTAKETYESAKGNPVLYDEDDLTELAEAYNAAKQNYKAMLTKYDEENLKEQIKDAENQLKSLTDALEDAEDTAKTAMENAEASMKNAEAAKENARLTYENALKSRDTAEEQNTNTGEDYSIAVKNAEDALEQAKKDYDSAVSQAESELSSLKKLAEKQRTVSGLNDPQVIILQNLKDKLEYAVVTAPCDGVVTAVNAEEGAVPMGALFTIEDLSDLKITSSVGEYDIPYVREGMSATIRCDALDGAEYSGKVTDAAPTALQTAAASGNGTAASYRIETSVDGEDGRLLVGMSTKVEIISEKRENALTVTYDALTTDENGNDAVYIAEKDESGVWHARLVTVKIGLETDYEIEVISDELKADMLVLTDTAMISDGSVVNIDETADNNAEQTEQVTE